MVLPVAEDPTSATTPLPERPVHSRDVATQTIVQSLAYISWALLTALALGSLALAWLLRQATDVTKGYVGFTCLSAALLALLALLTDLSLPDPDQLAIVAAHELDLARRAALGAFVALGVVAGVRALGDGLARWSGAGAVVTGVTAELVAALGWAGGTTLGLPLFVQLLALSAAAGGSLACVALAHWYLVTPRIPEDPLVLATKLLTLALALQLLLFLAWQAVGIPEGPPFSALTGPNAVLVWLRLLIGIVFPLVLAWLAWRTALTRSMESATGLLYIELAAVLASTIVGTGLAFGTGLLV
jgi:hypothetical protein